MLPGPEAINYWEPITPLGSSHRSNVTSSARSLVQLGPAPPLAPARAVYCLLHHKYSRLTWELGGQFVISGWGAFSVRYVYSSSHSFVYISIRDSDPKMSKLVIPRSKVTFTAYPFSPWPGLGSSSIYPWKASVEKVMTFCNQWPGCCSEYWIPFITHLLMSQRPPR